MSGGRALKALSGFTLSVLVTSIANFATIPLIIAGIGAEAWASLAVGQSVGMLASIFAGLGWGYNGPNQVAAATAVQRAAIIDGSVRLRLRWAVLTCVVPSIAVALLLPREGLAAAIACAATASAGLGFSWYFVGSGDPRGLLLWDAVPRASAIFVGAGVALAIGSAAALSAVLLLGAVIAGVGSLAASRRALGEAWHEHRRCPRSQSFSSRQIYALLSATTASAYTAAPLVLIAALAPTATSTYALADRMNRIASVAATPANQWLQGWVPSAGSGAALQARVRKAMVVALAMSIMFGGAVALVAPPVSRLLSRDAIEVPFEVAIPMGLAVFFAMLSRATGMSALLSLGEERLVALSTGFGAVLGVTLMSVAVPHWGAAGAAWSVTAAEAAVCGTQVTRVAMRLRRPADAPSST